LAENVEIDQERALTKVHSHHKLNAQIVSTLNQDKEELNSQISSENDFKSTASNAESDPGRFT
jgi:hypothetical protein